MGPWSVLAARWLSFPAVWGLKGHSIVAPVRALFCPLGLTRIIETRKPRQWPSPSITGCFRLWRICSGVACALVISSQNRLTAWRLAGRDTGKSNPPPLLSLSAALSPHAATDSFISYPDRNSIQPRIQARQPQLPPDPHSRTSPDDDLISGSIYDGIWPR